jgi:hypothetical protein
MSTTFYITQLNHSHEAGISGEVYAYRTPSDLQVYDPNPLMGTLGGGGVVDLSNAFTLSSDVSSTETTLDATSDPFRVGVDSSGSATEQEFLYNASEITTNTDLSYAPSAATTKLFFHTKEQIDSHRTTYLENVSLQIFGSPQATDFLFNGQALMDAFNVDISNVADRRSVGKISNVAHNSESLLDHDEKTEIAEELFKSMLYHTPERFGMGYEAEVTVSSGLAGLTVGNSVIFGAPEDVSDSSIINAAIDISQSGVATMAKASVEILKKNDGAVIVKHINIMASGSGYQLKRHGGGNIIIQLTQANAQDKTVVADGDAATVTIAAAKITPIQIAMLNGTLDQPTSFPFVEGDKIRTKVTIKPHPNQKTIDEADVSNNAIMDYSVFCDYEVTSDWTG